MAGAEANEQELPLQGIRVLELGMNVAVPTCDRILADMGAEVIKIESPTHIEHGRRTHLPDDRPGERFWNEGGLFHENNRNKLSLTLNLNFEEGREAFLELLKTSDVVLENFTPRVMPNFGLGYERLRTVKPDIIMVSNTGFGQTGPWANYKAFGMTMEGDIGLSHLTGYQGGPPTRTAIAYADTPTGIMLAFNVLSALHHRERTGKGQWIDVSMYQVGVALIGQAMMDFSMNGRMGERTGNREPGLSLQGCYPCRGRDQWVAISLENEGQWEAFCEAIKRPELARDPRFADVVARQKHQDRLDGFIQEWTSTLTNYEAMKVLQAAGIAAGPVLSGKGLLQNPHLAERGFFEWVQHPADHEHAGKRLHAGMPWKMRNSSPRIRTAGPSLGSHNRHVLGDLLGYAESHISAMRAKGVISEAPTNKTKPSQTEFQELLAQGSVWPPEPEYKEILERRPRPQAE